MFSQVCDSRCGSGLFGDLHCNWRSLGPSCRYCFNDLVAARLADEVASTRGGRIIMCSTHEPPPATEAIDSRVEAADSWMEAVFQAAGHVEQIRDSSDDLSFSKASSIEDSRRNEDPAHLEFAVNVTRGEMCAFVPGYLEFLAETNLTVSSINIFMPGMKIAVLTHPIDFHVYNRYDIVNNSQCQLPGQRTQSMVTYEDKLTNFARVLILSRIDRNRDLLPVGYRY